MKHLSIQVIGKVQGVWFRVYTQKEANKLGLSGFVRNEPDGSVYIELSGPEPAVSQFLVWCKSGSPLSSVDNLIIDENDRHYRGAFIIKR